VLGAGLDTTALRHPELDVLEIDLAETQAWKRERLAVAGLAVPPRCRLVPVDFTRDDLAAVLAREGVGPAAPAFFIWLGVSYYLDAAAVRATLAAVAATGPDAAVVFDAYRALEELADDARDRLLAIGARVRDVGEPFIGLFGRAELAALAASAGLPAVDIESDADLLARYGADPGLALGFADLVHARAR
ncbi:MAG: SAM-dependent methyltransferase, partial [Myxococcales bacterium]|nr:SAM-dependent methyltransferase [Myxococcales bacterium]